MTLTATRLVCSLDGPLDVPADSWVSEVSAADLSVIGRTRGPALDVGCGPGRHVVALSERGISSLGIDVTPQALLHAKARGAVVLHRSVFDRVPAAGRWASALLLDGNIGIGGDPVALLVRVASLVRPGGNILVELGAPGSTRGTRTVRLDIGEAPGPWFALASVTADELDAVASAARLAVTDRWAIDERWFATLRRTH